MVMLAKAFWFLAPTILGGVRVDSDDVKKAMEESSSVVGICPPGFMVKSKSWVENGWYLIDGYYYRYKNCESCTQAPSDWKLCGTQGRQVGGKYGYGDGGNCKSKNGCRCTESRQSGNANTGFTMVSEDLLFFSSLIGHGMADLDPEIRMECRAIGHVADSMRWKLGDLWFVQLKTKLCMSDTSCCELRLPLPVHSKWRDVPLSAEWGAAVTAVVRRTISAAAAKQEHNCTEPTSRQRNPYMDWWLRKWRLILYTVCLLVASVGNTVFFKRMTSAMPNYGWYLTQLSTLIYVPFFATLVGTGITQQVDFELVRKFALMGVFDGLSGTFMVLGGVHTSGTLQVLLGQAVIPVTMMLSVMLLRKQYHMLQYLGATTIVMGIVLDKAMLSRLVERVSV
ncbi:crtp1 [Symbiodinium necroappetens]|uniref:Crtp1 protein n=1 Tax=Symbiodinium necroappetens TaxID=1628268 RepID=A0A812TVY1_9DINO|nr:crtp1 [Symbiodinium necroappetens]